MECGIKICYPSREENGSCHKNSFAVIAGGIHDMFLETKRLIIRSIRTSDEKAFIEMASDGSLTEIFGEIGRAHV